MATNSTYSTGKERGEIHCTSSKGSSTNSNDIYKYLKTTEPPPKIQIRTRPSEKLILPFKTQIKELADTGYTVQQIHEKIRDIGFQGSHSAIRIFLSQYRKSQKEGSANETLITITRRQIASYIWTGAAQLTEKKQSYLEQCKKLYPFLSQVEQTVQTYIEIFKNKDFDAF